jgi:hypothetical protein
MLKKNIEENYQPNKKNEYMQQLKKLSLKNLQNGNL